AAIVAVELESEEKK
ncbi:unnamed protein product, partial [Tilletia laevis]